MVLNRFFSANHLSEHSGNEYHIEAAQFIDLKPPNDPRLIALISGIEPAGDLLKNILNQ